MSSPRPGPRPGPGHAEARPKPWGAAPWSGYTECRLLEASACNIVNACPIIISPSKKKVERAQRITSFGRVYGEKLACMHVECYWYDEYDTLHLPIPVLYEMIFLLLYEYEYSTSTFGA